MELHPAFWSVSFHGYALFKAEFRHTAEGGRRRETFLFFLSDGDIRADAPSWWIIDYMNNCCNYSAATMIVRDTLLIRGGCCRVWFGVGQKEDEGGWCVRSPTNMCWCCRVLVGRDGWIWGVTNLRSCFATGRKKKKGTARNILVRSWCLAQWLFPLLASPPLHDKSDVCLLLKAHCVLISGSLVVFLRLCSGVTGHVLTHPERPHLKKKEKQAKYDRAQLRKKTKNKLLLS